MNKFTSMLSLLALLASTSLTAAFYNDYSANLSDQSEPHNLYNQTDSHGSINQPLSRDSMNQQDHYFRQDGYDYPSHGTNLQTGANENINLRGIRDENVNLRGMRNENINEQGHYFRQDGYDYPSQGNPNIQNRNWNRGEQTWNQGGYNQPQPYCPGGQCNAGANYSNDDHYRNQNFSGYSSYDNRNQIDRRNNQYANREWNKGDDMSTRIRNKIQNDPSLSADARNIQITFDDGTALLKGNVNSDAEKTKIESLVQQVDGVKSVTNKLNVSK